MRPQQDFGDGTDLIDDVYYFISLLKRWLMHLFIKAPLETISFISMPMTPNSNLKIS
jgi:hypothetical protein